MKKTLLFLLFSIVTTAQSLDATFDTDGLVNNPISNMSSVQNIFDGVLQTDGKMIYVGRYYNNGSGFTTGLIIRYNVDGTKDLSFNNTGFKNSNLGLGLQFVCLQSDGKILVSGSNSLYRLQANGDLDLTFNTLGYKTISLSGQNMNIKCISVQSDDKIVVSGYISNGTNTDLAVARLNVDGTLDTAFDTDGIFTYNSSTIDTGFSHKIQADGKIVIVGDTGATAAAKNFLIVRINSNGTLDTSFNSTGIITTDFASTSDLGRDVQILSDNSIFVLGRSAGNVAIAKYTSTGALDVTFNATGKKTFSIPMDLFIFSGLDALPKIKILSTGSILISCSSTSDFRAIKLDSNGNFDATFATNGIFTSNIETDLSTFLQIKSNGNIITGGISYTTAINNDAKIKELELTANGLIINSETKSLFLSFDRFVAMAKNTNGDIFVLANAPNPTLLKYNSFGQLDVTFGSGGKINLPNTAEKDCKIQTFLDKIFIYLDNGIYKFNSNGALDTSFDSDGFIDIQTVLTNFNSNYFLSNIDDFKLDYQGNLIIALDFGLYSPYQVSMGVLKFLNNGIIDVTFGNNGLFTTRFNSDLNYYEYPQQILLQNDLKIKIVGLFVNPIISNEYTFCSFRMNSNGVLDTSFGTLGKTTQTFVGLNNWPQNSYLFSDDSVLCFMKSITNSDIKSIKILADGNVDLSHGTNGIADDIIATNNFSMVFQPDGKYLKAGVKNNRFSISRYHTDGSVDTSFGINGELNTIVDYASSITDILLQPDGKIVVGGVSTTSDYQFSVLARFTNTTLGTLDFNSTKNALSIYPNPIETAATFEFTLMNPENITIELYDVQGKLVQTIATNKEMAPGNHNLPIELNQNLTSGNYFLKLSTPKGSQSIQIIKK